MQSALMADENVKEKNWKVIRFPLIYCYVRGAIRILQYLGIFSRLTMPICRHNLNQVCLFAGFISHAIQKVYVCNFEHGSRAITDGFECESVSICEDAEAVVAATNNSHRLQSILFLLVAHWPQPNAISFDWKWIFDDAIIANGDLSSLTPLRQISCGLSTGKKLN